MGNGCLFCGGNASEPDHWAHCDGRQGAIEAAVPDFDGETYDPPLDHDRLAAQLLLVLAVMRDQTWRTLAEIEALTGAPQASISARLRDLRKAKFGGWTVERRRRGIGRQGWFEYRVLAVAHAEMS